MTARSFPCLKAYSSWRTYFVSQGQAYCNSESPLKHWRTPLHSPHGPILYHTLVPTLRPSNSSSSPSSRPILTFKHVNGWWISGCSCGGCRLRTEVSQCYASFLPRLMNDVHIIAFSEYCGDYDDNERIIKYFSPDKTAVCKLASITLPTFITNGKYNFNKLHRVVAYNLNKIIDVSWLNSLLHCSDRRIGS